MRQGLNRKPGFGPLPGAPVSSLCVRPACPLQAYSFRHSYPSGLGGRWSLVGKEGGQSVQSSNYWSGSTNVNNPSNAWNVNMNNGNVNNANKTNTNYVWPVRGGE